MRRPWWFHESEDFRRWRLGLEERDPAEPYTGPYLPFLILMLPLWVLDSDDHHDWWFPVVIVLVLIQRLVTSCFRHYRPDLAELADLITSLWCAVVALGFTAAAATYLDDGWGRLLPGLVAAGCLVSAVSGIRALWRLRRARRSAPRGQDELDITR